MSDDALYEGFSCPQVGMNQGLIEQLIIGHAQETAEAFVAEHGARLDTHGAGLTRLLTEWLSVTTTFETVWHLTFGNLYGALFSEETGEQERAAASVALRLHECRQGTGEWRLSLPNATQLSFAGWLLPPCDMIAVVATAEDVLIRTVSDGTSQCVRFVLEGDDWRPVDPSALPLTITRAVRWPDLTVEMLSRDSVSRLLAADAYGAAFDAADLRTDLLTETSRGAQDLLSEYAGIYAPWVDQVVRCVIPLPERLGVVNSSSGNFAPGVITVSNQRDPYVLADMLVHEGTHQYLYIIKRLGPVEDGTDQTLYFSPFRNMDRPILYIVFAYHAFGNVLLFYRLTRAAGVTPAAAGIDIDADIRKLEGQLLTLEEHLHTTRALTPIGRALWEPLSHELRLRQ